MFARAGWRCGGFPGSTIGLAARRQDPQFRLLDRRRVRTIPDRGHHGEGEHDERDMAVPPVPGTALVVVEAEFVFGSLEAVLDGPAMPST